MQRSQSQILTALFLLLVASLTGCNADYAYGHRYGEHSCRRTQSQSDCSFERYLGSDEFFEFPQFPPQSQSSPAYAYGNGPYRPRCSPYLTSEECTWTFVTDDDCVLEYYTDYFWRGEPDCGQQHFFIGDEETEIRVCGFDRPPKHFRSTGKELFLGHFQQNRYCCTVSSAIRGGVRCVKGPGRPSVHEEYPCPTLPPTNCSTLIFLVNKNKGDRLTINGTFGGEQYSVSNICNSTQCNMTATACVSATVQLQQGDEYERKQGGQEPYVCDEDGWLQSPPTLSDGCHNETIPCQTSGACSGTNHIQLGTSGFGDIPITCNATSDYQQCTEVVTVCTTTTTP